MADRTVKVTIAAEMSGYMRGIDQAARKTRELGTEADRLAQKREAFDALGRSAVAFGAAALAGVGLAVKAAVDWESAWAGVLKTNDGTVQQLDALQGGLRDLARELPASHTEIAAVAEAAGQLGVQVDNVVAFTRTMIDLGETTNLSANEAATELARFMNVMGTAQSDVDRLGSAVVDLGNNYATTEAEIVSMAQRLSGAGRQIGLSEGEVLGLATALSSVGIEAEAGGSAISKVMIEIASQVATGGDKLALFARTAGMSAEDFTRAWKDEPGRAMAAFVKGLSNAEAQGTSTIGVLQDLGITEIRMRDALLRSAAAADQFAETMQTGNAAWEENTALLTEAEKRYATTESQLEILGNRFNEAAINLGTVFLPRINEAADGLGVFADFMAGLDEPTANMIISATAVAGGFALVGGAALIATPKIAQFRANLAALNLTGGQLAKNFAKGGGVFLAITAIAGGLSNLGREANLSEEQVARLNAAAKNADLESFTSQLRLGGTAGSTMADALDELTGGHYVAWVRDATAAGSNFLAGIPLIGQAFGGLADDANRNEAAFKRYGDALGGMVQSDFPEAIRGFQALAAGTDGSEQSISRLLEVMPGYKSALIDLAAEQGITIDEQDLLNLAMGEGELAAQLLSDAADDTRRSLGNVSAAAADSTGTLDELTEAMRNFNNQQYAADDALFNFKQSLLDLDTLMGAEGFTGTLDINTAEGLENNRMLREITGGANAAAAEILALTGNQQDANAVLEEARDRLIEVAAKFGLSRDEMQEFIDTYLNSPHELTFITGETGLAELRSKYQSFYNEWNGRHMTFYADGTISFGNPNVVAKADGGFFSNGVQAFASGGFPSGMYPYRHGGIHKFAEAGDEMYLSFLPQYRSRNLDLLGVAAERLGVWRSAPPVQQPGFSAEQLTAAISKAMQPQPGAPGERTVRLDGDDIREVGRTVAAQLRVMSRTGEV